MDVIRSKNLLTSTIDLSRLPSPELVAQISAPKIMEEMRDSFLTEIRKTYPEYKLLDSDPISKLIEVAAYRETLVRQTVNDTAKECLVAFATGANLEHLAALFQIEREDKKQLVEDENGQSQEIPVLDDDGNEVKEDDQSLREKVLLGPDRFSTAGAEAAYRWNAKKIGTPLGLVDVTARSPQPNGEVIVTLLFEKQQLGEAVDDEKTVVENYLNHENIKPLNDIVVVKNAIPKEIEIAAELEIRKGISSREVLESAMDSLEKFKADRYRIGENVPLSGIYAALSVPNVKRVVLKDITSDIEVGDGEFAQISFDSESIREVEDEQ